MQTHNWQVRHPPDERHDSGRIAASMGPQSMQRNFAKHIAIAIAACPLPKLIGNATSQFPTTTFWCKDNCAKQNAIAACPLPKLIWKCHDATTAFQLEGKGPKNVVLIIQNNVFTIPQYRWTEDKSYAQLSWDPNICFLMELTLVISSSRFSCTKNTEISLLEALNGSVYF